MPDEDRERYFLNADNVRRLSGRTVKEIRREGESIFIEFTDGTGAEISADRPSDIRLMIYHWQPEADKNRGTRS